MWVSWVLYLEATESLVSITLRTVIPKTLYLVLREKKRAVPFYNPIACLSDTAACGTNSCGSRNCDVDNSVLRS